MASDLKPSTWLGAGYTVNTGSHIISMTTNTASSNKILTNLTDAQADPTTGDIRQIAYAFMEALLAANVAQVGGANASTRMAVTKTISADASGNIRFNYTVSISVAPGSSIPSE